ncbi:MAG: hypothetical protein OFPI_12410 [Osedax symbiont Rs2]|nr:MAG: hypothetical protein OFPI_12410 [Osedax symbiont Rs2]
MPEINIDGKTYQVTAGKNLLQACQELKLQLPYFCWHPALDSVGSCRQCAVLMFQNDQDTRGRITMACMTAVSDGQRFSIQAGKAQKFRQLCIEATMTSHPHDCPVCEEAGECHLQDMTLISGHIERRFQGPKRTHKNQYLGPFINHEMNRCIACYRCVRYYRDYSGGTDLNVFSSRNNVFFGRAQAGVLESEFSGNLAEVCPTGVFTDKTYSAHYSRKWDLQSAPAVCVHCSIGCNTFPAERNGILRRITNRYHPQINGYFLCDRGRFGYDFVNHAQRTEHAWQRNNSSQTTEQLNSQRAQDSFSSYLKNTEQLLAIGSSRSSLENNFCLQSLVGAENFYSDNSAQLETQLQQLLDHYRNVQPSSDLNSLEASDTVLLIGADVTQSAPRIALSIRQMIKNAGIAKAATLGVAYWSAAEVQNIRQQLKSPLHIISSHSTRLDDIARSIDNNHPHQQLALINEICSCFSKDKSNAAQSPADDDSIAAKAKAIYRDLLQAEKPFIVTGIHPGQPVELLLASLKLSAMLYQHNKQAGLICAVPWANSLGLALLTDRQQNIDTVLQRLEMRTVKTLVILETDLYRYCSTQKMHKLLADVENIIVLDHLITATGEQADLLLPSSSFAEQHGSWVNYEARLQHSLKCFAAASQRRPAYQWLTANTPLQTIIKDLSGVAECLRELPSLYSIKSDDFHVARKTVRESGRTALHSFINIKDIQPDADLDSNYQHSQEGLASNLHNNQSPAYIWSPHWNSSESLNQFQDSESGAIQGAHSGLLLFARRQTANSCVTQKQPFDSVKESSADSQNVLRVLPFEHIFADEELSRYVEHIGQLAPADCIRINTAQAQRLGLIANQLLDYSFVTADGSALESTEPASTTALPLTIDDSIAAGVALLPTLLLQRAPASVVCWLSLASAEESSDA